MKTPTAVHFNALLLLGLILTASAVTGGTATVDFEGLASTSNLPGSPVPPSAQLSNQLRQSHGVTFRSESGNNFVAVVRIGTESAPSGINAIGAVNAAGRVSYVTPFTVDFFVPGQPGIPGVTDSVSIQADLFGGGGIVTLEAFDANGSVITTNTGVDLNGVTLRIDAPGIRSARVTASTDNIAWDDLTFNTPVRLVNHLNIQIETVRISWATETNKVYQLQYSSVIAPGEWLDLGDPVNGTGNNTFLSNIIADQPRRVYRLVITP